MKDELNRAMAAIMGRCWHRFIPTKAECVGCGEIDDQEMGVKTAWVHTPQSQSLRTVIRRNLDYVDNLNLVREVELKLVEMGLAIQYEKNLITESKALKMDSPGWFLRAITADAETRCRAIIKTWEEK